MPRAVVVGASKGGLRALQTLLRGLPASFPVPIVVVQHRHATSDDGFATLLGGHSALPVIEAEDKETLATGRVHVAPPDYHLLVDGDALALSTDGPVNHSRPSIDVLFESAAHRFGGDLVAIVLTGSTADGARGAAAVRTVGGRVIVENPATAESPMMPESAAPWADEVLDLERIAARLVELCTSREG